jgi:hypothetical protein
MHLLITCVARPPRLILKVVAPFPQTQERAFPFFGLFCHAMVVLILSLGGRTLVVGL